MFKFTKCDFCLVKRHYEYVYSAYNWDTGISPLTCDFLLNNLIHYCLKRCCIGSTDAEKKHAKHQIRRILYIFEKYGIPEELVNDAMKHKNRRQLLRMICNSSMGV